MSSITVAQPDLRRVRSWVDSSNVQEGSLDLDRLSDIGGRSVLGRSAGGNGPVEVLLANANGQVLKRSGDVVSFGALDATDWAPQLASINTWSARQTFSEGVVIARESDPPSPAVGQLWLRTTDGALMIREPGGVSMPVEASGTWTPSLRPDTLGDFNAVYSQQEGGWIKIGRYVGVWLNLVTSTLTWTTASGTMRIIGLPFPAAASVSRSGTALMHTLAGLSLNTTAGLMEPKLAVSGGGNTSCLLRRTITGANTGSGSLALGSGNGFISNQQVTMQGGILWYVTNEA